jgi:hypothetical protein
MSECIMLSEFKVIYEYVNRMVGRNNVSTYQNKKPHCMKLPTDFSLLPRSEIVALYLHFPYIFVA